MTEAFFGEHGAFISASYVAVIVVLAAVIGWIYIDGRNLRREIEILERAGIGRRRQPQTEAPKPNGQDDA